MSRNSPHMSIAEAHTPKGKLDSLAPLATKTLVDQVVDAIVEAAKRIDALAVAVWEEMTVDEFSQLDLAYAPPFSPVWDPTMIATRKAGDKVR